MLCTKGGALSSGRNLVSAGNACPRGPRVPLRMRATPSNTSAPTSITTTSPHDNTTTELPPQPSSTATATTSAPGTYTDTSFATARTPETAPAPEPERSTFNWTSQWYPMAVTADLDPQRPTQLHLLGIAMAVWRDKEGAWHAVEDRCSHRLAPLSEGRIETDGSLACAYHGWRFNGSGTCTHIPQLIGNDKAQQTACSSKRSCVRSFPVQHAHGLLWVMPDASPEGWRRAASEPVPSNALQELLPGPNGAPPVFAQFGNWFVRDLPIKADTLMENLLDPCHVPFAHHGVMGKRDTEKGTKAKIEEMGPDGFTASYNMTGKPSLVSLRAPSLTKYDIMGGAFSIIIYAVPTKPGWSRAIHGYVQDTRVPIKLPGAILAVTRAIASIKWLDHIRNRQPIFDGDTYFLHVQERSLLQSGNDWHRNYFMPSSADAPVIGLRRWLEEHGGGGMPTCGVTDTLPPPLPKAAVLDRYGQHVQHCHACKQALRNTEIATGVVAAGGVLAALWALARVAVGLPPADPTTLAVAAVAAAAAGGVAVLRALKQQFIYVDYVHADKN